jgi:hypothetical protein
MRDLLSDSCHVLPVNLVEELSTTEPQRHEFLRIQLKKGPLDDVISLVSDPAFKCAPRFPGRMPSLINVEDKKSMIRFPELFPGYVIPKVGFCFDVGNRQSIQFDEFDRVVDEPGRSKVGIIIRRIDSKMLMVKWFSDKFVEKEEKQSELLLLDKVRVVITHKEGSLDEHVSSWCSVKTAFTTSDSNPSVAVRFKNDASESTLVISDSKDFFEEDIVYENSAKLTLLDQCYEYSILKGTARRLAESFDQLSRLSQEHFHMKALKKNYEAAKEQEKERELKHGSKINDKLTDDEVKAREVIAHWAEAEGSFQRLNDGDCFYCFLYFSNINACLQHF